MTPIWTQKTDLARLNARGKNTMIDYLHIEIIEAGDNYLIGKMPVTQHTHQPMGILHGGASCVLAETVGSLAANMVVDNADYYCVGLDINTNHIRSIREGFIFAKAEPFHLGKSTQVWGINIRNADHQLISVTRLTMAVLKQKGK